METRNEPKPAEEPATENAPRRRGRPRRAPSLDEDVPIIDDDVADFFEDDGAAADRRRDPLRQ